MKIGGRIRKLRRACRISQEAFAERMGMSVRSVSRWERGERNPPLRLIPVIAACFGVSTDYLLGLEMPCPAAYLIETTEVYETATRRDAEELLEGFVDEGYPGIRDACIRKAGRRFRLTVTKEFGLPLEERDSGQGST